MLYFTSAVKVLSSVWLTDGYTLCLDMYIDAHDIYTCADLLGWSLDYGGMTVYVAKDEDEEVSQI